VDETSQVRLLEQAYRLFNERDVDALLAMMTDDVEWPDVANGTVLHGKNAIRAYWQGQFAVADPHVTPTDFLTAGEDLVAVIQQEVLDLQGEPLGPSSVVYHRYQFAGDLVRRMTVAADRDEACAPR